MISQLKVPGSATSPVNVSAPVFGFAVAARLAKRLLAVSAASVCAARDVEPEAPVGPPRKVPASASACSELGGLDVNPIVGEARLTVTSRDALPVFLELSSTVRVTLYVPAAA